MPQGAQPGQSMMMGQAPPQQGSYASNVHEQVQSTLYRLRNAAPEARDTIFAQLKTEPQVYNQVLNEFRKVCPAQHSSGTENTRAGQ